MKLLTKKNIKTLPKLYEQEKAKTQIAYVKLFTPFSSWTWYIMEYDGKDTCYGLVDGFEKEYGYFSLSELQNSVVPIERDLYFTPTDTKKLL